MAFASFKEYLDHKNKLKEKPEVEKVPDYHKTPNQQKKRNIKRPVARAKLGKQRDIHLQQALLTQIKTKKTAKVLLMKAIKH